MAPIRVLLIPSSDYLGHPFPQRHNHIFERLRDGKEFEVHVVRFQMYDKPKLSTRCIIHEIPYEIKTRTAAAYYLANAAQHAAEIYRIVKTEGIDVVVAGNLLPPLLYRLLSKLHEKKIPFIFDLQDYYPTSAAGYLADVDSVVGTALKGVFEAMTQYLIKHADLVATPGIALAMYAKEVGAKKVAIIPNGISEHFLQKYDGREIRQKLGYRDEDIVVGYVGSLEFWLDMQSLIKAVAKARRDGHPVKLLLIGKHLQTGYPRQVEKWIRQHNIERNTIWLDFVPHEHVPKYIAGINIATIPFNPRNPTAYYAAPNKLWEYLSQEVPLAATPIPETTAHKHLLHLVHSADDYYEVIVRYAKGHIKLPTNIHKLLQKRMWANSVMKMKDVIMTVSKTTYYANTYHSY